MPVLNFALPIVSFLFLSALLSRSVRDNRFWRASVTPLASIIGSGFLIAAPLLGGIVGPMTPWAMVLIVIVAYSIGSVIRFNIRFAEPQEENQTASPTHKVLEHFANIGLLGAYIISVTFYLRLMSSFILQGTGALTDINANILTTLILLLIGVTGWRRGLGALERLEEFSVSIKLAIIGAFLVGLAIHDTSAGLWGNVPQPPDRQAVETWRMLAGMLLIVQGFETSRYLGREYTADIRIRSMRFSQLLSGLIYIGFAFLILPLLHHLSLDHPDETAIIDLSRYVSPVLPVMLIFAATMSQFSAAVADILGGGGLIAEESQERLSPNPGYLAISVCAIVLVWSTSIFEIITYASRAFAFYYFTQSLIGFHVALDLPNGWYKWRCLIGLGLMAGLLGWVTLYAISVD